ncbi:MAG: 50S ribosomal protein L18 [Candidatus Aenigmarchaeota archaeon]|nr:50S ribosomal protein L18 [Candidatus Aenigmarchaeota archaeon]
MKLGPRYKMPFKRRFEDKTDYKKRLGLLLSGKSRLVIRTSTKHVQVQVIKYEPEGDKTLLSAHTQELKGMGWKHSTSNIPAAYLTGLLIGKKAKKKKIKSLVVDFGPQRIVKSSRLFSVLKGAIDAGLDVSCSEEVLPTEERLKGEHIVKYSEGKNVPKNQFSKVKPKNLGKDIEKIKKKIMKD